jgi:hypothetical protein
LSGAVKKNRDDWSCEVNRTSKTVRNDTEDLQDLPDDTKRISENLSGEIRKISEDLSHDINMRSKGPSRDVRTSEEFVR